MKDLEKKIVQLKKAGKTQKIEIYREIIEICYEQKNTKLFQYFDEMLMAVDNYLKFDDKPIKTVGYSLADSFEKIFSTLKITSNLKLFPRYFKKFEELQHLINSALLRAFIYQSFGYLFWLKEDVKKSLYYLKNSLKLLDERGIVDEIPRRYTNIGYVYEFMGELKKAEKYYLQGLDFAENNNYTDALKAAYSALGRLYLQRKLLNTASEFFQKGLALYPEDNQDPERATIINNLCLAYTYNKQYDQAIEALQTIDRNSIKEIDLELYYSILFNLGVCYMHKGEYETAEEYYIETIEYTEENSLGDFYLRCKINLGIVEWKKGNSENALEHLESCLPQAEKTKNHQHQYEIFNLLGEIYQEKKEYAKAVRSYKRAIKIKEKNDLYGDIESTLKNLAVCQAKLNNFEKAYENLGKSINMHEQYHEQLEEKKIAESGSLIKSGLKSEYIYNNSLSLISREMSAKIGNEIIGNSKLLQEVIEKAYLVAGNKDASVTIKGESGTGKDLIARLIHFASARAKYRFTPINSAVFTEGLAQSTLFGHVKGAFTGANGDHTGYFKYADKGSIFFDEVSDMPQAIQSQLLRVIETRKVRPVGSDREIKTDFRLICATNKDLSKLLEKNEFRFDLYNRIKTLEISIPPLRERRDDIPLLIDHFMDKISRRLHREKPTISAQVIENLMEYDYPGNVRELISIMEKLILFCEKNKIEKEDVHFLRSKQIMEIKESGDLNLNLTENEQKLIELALEKADKVKVEAAKLLGISPYSLYRRLKKLDIKT